MQDHTPASALDNAIALQKYGVGQPVRRKEDDTLVRGKGKYTDDFTLPGQAYCWMVRSSHAHGNIKGIGTAAAKAMPGVLGVWTGKDLEAAGYNPFTCGMPLKRYVPPAPVVTPPAASSAVPKMPSGPTLISVVPLDANS